jgi:hypothetical protein
MISCVLPLNTEKQRIDVVNAVQMAPRHVSFSSSNELVPPDGSVLCRDYRVGNVACLI